MTPAARLIVRDDDACYFGVGVDDHDLALNEIDAVGPGGSHLGRDLTRHHHRDFWSPALFDRAVYDRWHAAGATTLKERVEARTAALRAEPRAFTLDPDVRGRLEAALATATRRRIMTDVTALSIFPARLHLAVLSEAEVQAVHEAALALLGAAAAAGVPAAAQAPVLLPGRVPEHDVLLDGGHCWLAAGAFAAPAQTVRTAEGAERAATAADLDDACRLADALPEVALLAGPPLRADGVSRLGALAAALSATTKHVLATDLHSAAEGQAAAALGAAAAAPHGRAPLSLCAGPDGREAALAAARAGLAVGLVLPPAADGAPPADAGPADIGPALVRHHAAVLAGLAAVRAAAPAAPFLYLAAPRLAGLAAVGAAAVRFHIAAAQLAAHVGLPVVGEGLATASPEPDWLACTQNAFGALGATATGAGITAGAGTLRAGRCFSAQELVLDSELFSWNAAIAAGIQVDDETVALEAIKQVGIGGNFLSQRHTRRHMRDVWRPRLLDRSMWDAWVAGGREGAAEKAAALAQQLLAGHTPAPLGDEARGAMARVVAKGTAVLS